MTRLGLGIGWRPELAWFIDRRDDLGFIEIIAESLDPREPIPKPIENLMVRGVRVIPHGVSLSLGGAQLPDRERLARLGELAAKLNAPLISEHLAFVRAGDFTSGRPVEAGKPVKAGRPAVEAGHLLPLPRTSEMLDVVVENILAAQEALPVPLAIENISTLVEWPDGAFDEATFLAEVIERTGVELLLDVANVYANSFNHGINPTLFFDTLPLEKIAYVHVGGGEVREGVYHDTHTHAVPGEALKLLDDLSGRIDIPGVMLERDGCFPPDTELASELDAIKRAVSFGESRREQAHV